MNRIRNNNGWDPTSPGEWTRKFGFVASKLFPPNTPNASTSTDVLRDGRLLSFILLGESVTEEDSAALSWSWSAQTRYLLRLYNASDKLVILRWDLPSKLAELSIDSVKRRPALVLDHLRQGRSVQEQDAISHVLQIFRSLRSRVPDSESAIRYLHLLLSTDESIDEYIRNLDPLYRVGLSGLRNRLLCGNERLGLALHPELLLRHAAAELFQEAHVEADRQIYFLGMSPPARIDKLPPEVRYTPAHLARVLCEVALSKLSSRLDRVRVLDPACGSGVFLTEVATLAFGARQRRLELRGYDTSSVAAELAETCIKLATSTETETNCETTIEKKDSLTEEWATCDLILMNPPFRAYPDMDNAERSAVMHTLGDLALGRPDKALAFLWNAWRSLADGGVLAAVLPAGVLTGEAARKVREKIQEQGVVHVIGRFESHTFFRHSLIETGFVVIQKLVNTRPTTFIAVVASLGNEDDAIRSLRLLNANNEAGETDDVYRLKSERLAEANWFPHRRWEYDAIADVLSRGFPKAGDLFTISQGMRTGLKEAFVLTHNEVKTLPENEQNFFRPAAGQGTIRDGQLSEELYAFYPYARAGLRIANEQELLAKLPTYASNWLLPLKPRLEVRKKIEEWYLPTWPRSWQFSQQTKLVSTYFGQAGSFAVDEVGKHVVVDGHVWILKRPGAIQSSEMTSLLQAYCALLNSAVFEDLLRIYARRLQGGQIRLEPRFINSIPLPDLRLPVFRSNYQPQLTDLGCRIARSGLADVQHELEIIARNIYGR